MTLVALSTAAAPLTPAYRFGVAGQRQLPVVFGSHDSLQLSGVLQANGQQQGVDPNNILASYPALKLGREFSVHHRLTPDEPLKWHVKVALAPIGLYHFLTRHNPWWGETISKKGHVSCMFADGNSKQMSCSEYTTMAIKVMGQREGLLGSVKGWAYGLWRLGSCNPINLWRTHKNGHPPKDPQW